MLLVASPWSGLLLFASSLRMWPFAFCAVSGFPIGLLIWELGDAILR